MKKKIAELLENKIIQFLVTFIIFMTANFVALNDYVASNKVKTDQIIKNEAAIKNLDLKERDIEKSLVVLNIEKERQQGVNHEFDLKLSGIHNTLKNTISYQQVLRKEVKNLAENKINIDSFWRIIDKVELRLRYVERHTEKI